MSLVRSLTPDQLQVIGWIELYWHQNNEFPPVGKIEKQFPDFDLPAHLKHETFVISLQNRGIKIPNEQGLTDEQVAAVLVMVNFEDKRTRAAKFRAIGVHPTKWYGWLKDPTFKAFLHKMSTSHFDDSLHLAQEGLLKAVERGDSNAIKFFYELTGRYAQGNVTDSNFRIVIARMVESIQRHVRDPELLKAIAQDFEIIMRGEAAPVGQSNPRGMIGSI